MPSKSKIKGSNFEREIVQEFQEAGFEAKRAYASNGEALGLHREVDVLVSFKQPNQFGIEHLRQLKLQCKRRKELPRCIGLSENVDASVLRANNGESIIILRLEDFINRFLNE